MVFVSNHDGASVVGPLEFPYGFVDFLAKSCLVHVAFFETAVVDRAANMTRSGVYSVYHGMNSGAKIEALVIFHLQKVSPRQLNR